MSDTTNYFSTSQCVIPPIRTNVATAGLMTTTNGVIPAPSDLEGIYKSNGDYRLMEALFLWQWEANANAAEQSNLFKFLMATKVNLKGKVVTEQLNEALIQIRPFVQVKRKGPINNNYWKADSGVACSADGTSPGDGTHWKMTLSSLNGIPAHVGWFNPKEYVFVNGIDGDGNSIRWAGMVVSRSVVGSTVVVVMQPKMVQSNLSGVRKANPTQGAATRGAANVSNFESFCAQPPGLITSSLDPFWLGTTRWTFKTDELYEKWRDLVINDNKLYSELFDLPLAEYNKQVAQDFAQKHVESFFRNTKLPGQTVEKFMLAYDGTANGGLEIINTHADSVGGARAIGRRANPEGIYEQHVACDRVVDGQGLQLNIPALIQACYKMMRIRKASGAAPAAQKVFEIAMPSTFKVKFHQAMLNYYKDQWGDKVEWRQDISKTNVAPMGFLYTDYPLVWPDGMIFRVITDDYFDDYSAYMTQLAGADQFNNPAFANLARQIWIADWSRIYMGVTGTGRVTNQPGSDLAGMQRLGVFDPCVIETVKETNTLTWFSWTGIADCVPGNLIIENISDEIPEHKDPKGINYDEN